jgi:hypothetical protein
MALSVTVHGFMTLTGTQTAGRWGTANIATEDGADTVVYTVPSVGVDYMLLAISITNRAPVTASNVSVAVSSEITPRSYEFVEYNSSLVPSGTLERTQIVASPGDKIFVRWGIPEPRNELRVIDNSIAGAVSPLGVTILPDSTVVIADQLGGDMYLRKLDATGTQTTTAQYTFANSNVVFSPRTSDNIDIVCATTGTDTFYEFSDTLANSQNEGFEYGGVLGYENMTVTDFSVGGANDGVSTADMYKTSSGNGSSHLYTSLNVGGDIETGISVVWPGDVATGSRIKKYTTDNGTDTMLSTGWLDSGSSTPQVLWLTAFDYTTIDWDSYIAVGSLAGPVDDLEPVGHYYYNGNIWVLTANGRLIAVDATDGSVTEQYALGVDGVVGVNYNPGSAAGYGAPRLFHGVGNILFWVSSSGDAAQSTHYLWKYQIGQGLKWVHAIDHGDTSDGSSYAPYYLNTTTDRIYLQMIANEGASPDYHTFLYDILDTEGAVDLVYNNGLRNETIQTVVAQAVATTDLDQDNISYTVTYPTDITADEVDVVTSPLVASSNAAPTERLTTISPTTP